jgi:hypothetical protein
LVRTVEEIRQRWSERSRAGALHPHLEITGEGLVLGAGTTLAKMGGDSKGSPELSLGDERRIMAVLVTAYGRPLQAHVLAKMRRAAALWNGGDKALAHIHLAFTGLPPCDDMDLALRLFVADELIEAGASPATLMKVQGFNPPPLDMFNPAQPRWPAGNGDESGEWSGGGGNITPVAFRGGKERRRQGSRGRFNPFRAIGEFIDEFRKPKESEPVPEAKRPERETNVESQIKPFGTVESDLPRPGYGKEVSIPGLPNDITGTDVTKPRAREPNYETDLTRPEFESILSKLGWAKEPSPDGEAMNYWKDGARYSVRDYAKSTESPTAEFFHPFGNTNRDRKHFSR